MRNENSESRLTFRECIEPERRVHLIAGDSTESRHSAMDRAQHLCSGDGATRAKFTTQPRTPLASFHIECSSPLKRCKDASYDCERSYRAGVQQTRHRHAQAAIHDSREHKAAQACAGAHARIMTSTQTSEENYSTVQVACRCVELLHSWSTGTNRSPTAILL